MAHRPWHLFGGSGVLGLDLFGGGQPNPIPRVEDFTSYGGMGASSIQDAMRFRTQRNMPTAMQTEQQRIDWNTANTNYERIRAARQKRQEAYTAMSQKVGPTPSPYKSRMGTREAPPFFAQTAPVSRGPVDILAPEVETLDDIYRKRKNMFRMV